MMTQTQIQANKMWVDVMNGQAVTFSSDEETRVISREAVVMEVLDDCAEEVTALIISGRDASMYIEFKARNLIMGKLIEAIEDFENE